MRWGLGQGDVGQEVVSAISELRQRSKMQKNNSWVGGKYSCCIDVFRVMKTITG